MTDRILPLAIVVLAIADGILHLTLDIVLFRGRFFANELSILFLLNFIGYIVLGGAFLFRDRLLGNRAWLLNLLIGFYSLAAIVMWAQRHGPNPMGLGYLSKSLEVLLIVAVAAHWWLTQRSQPGAAQRLSA
jgi:hypothetical protein